MKKQRKPRVMLRNGCSRTQIFVSPANWKTAKLKSDIEKDWFVACKFYDPEHSAEFPNGIQFRKRLNEFKTLTERRDVIPALIEDMRELIDVRHYNPITGQYMLDMSGVLHPQLDFKTAIGLAAQMVEGSKSHTYDVVSGMKKFVKALDETDQSFIKIMDVRIYNIKVALDRMALTPNRYNKLRVYLSSIFKILIEYGCVEFNPIRDIRKKKTHPSIRELIPEWKLKVVDEYLKEKHPTFYRYRKIFHASGARSTELFRVQAKHVNLQAQEVLVQIQKGNTYKWEIKPINKSVLHFWNELVNLSTSPDDYIFSTNFMPGKVSINARQVTNKWREWVKSKEWHTEDGKPFIVTEDFYSFKHDYLDKLDAKKSGLARVAASHTSENTTAIYTVNRKRREIEFLKTVEV